MSFDFLRQTVQKGPFFDFKISPYSFFNVLASFQLTLKVGLYRTRPVGLSKTN